MKLYFWCFFSTAISFSCIRSQHEKPVIINDTTKITDTLILKDSISSVTLADTLLSGAYQGMFPCKDCEGIQQTILFNPDNTFKEERMIWSESDPPKMSVGIWKRKDGKIVLMQNNTPMVELIKKEDTLFITSINGVPISNSSKYILIKRNLAGKNPVWEKKREQGINFAAIGNDPVWNADIDFKKFVSFKLADWRKPIIVAIQNPIVTKDSMIYKMKSDSMDWSITIVPQFCSDGISGYLYEYKVNVNYKGNIYKGCGLMLSKKNS